MELQKGPAELRPRQEHWLLQMGWAVSRGNGSGLRGADLAESRGDQAGYWRAK
jgi:hypothetical protein